MKILFLLPPSEGKNSLHDYDDEELYFHFRKPLDIAHNVCENDLKCKGYRFQEGLDLNKKIVSSKSLEAINRYSGVMYNAIDYHGLSNKSKKFFDKHFMIFSGMYGIVRPLDKIGNYKLPIETKGLYKYWWDIIPNAIIELKVDYIVNLLPISYAKLIGEYTKCNRHKKKKEAILNAGIKIINVNFVKSDGKKISHGVKKLKGEWIKYICENNIVDYRQFGGEVIDNGNVIDVNVGEKISKF